MKVTGFTMVRNALKYDYPVVEAIQSILPICDNFVVAVGNSDDDTRKLIESIASNKIIIIDTIWDDTLRVGGQVLALETNKAKAAIPTDTDWAFYIQADEVVHEQYHATLLAEMQAHLHNPTVDGLLLKYEHFYGSYDYLGDSPQWYRREIRIIRNRPDIFSYRDAQGFRKGDNVKLNVKLIDAYMYHYGWVRPPAKMFAKQNNFARFYTAKDENLANTYTASEFDYSQINSLKLFEGTHPAVMHNRIAQKGWKFEHDISKKHFKPKELLKRFVERLTGYRLWEYKNYKIV